MYEWIKPLNAMDAAIRQILKQYPALLLIGPSKKKKDAKTYKSNSDNDVEMDTEMNQSDAIIQAESEAEVDATPPFFIHALSTILKFLSTLLRHGINKTLFNSVKELSNLLAAANDNIAALALEVLTNLVSPPLSHRLQSQETTPHTTALHALSNYDVHSRLILLAKGWGTKGCGLGFATCVTTDDSASGQGDLPRFAGEVLFEFLPPKASKPTTIELSQEEMYNEIKSDSQSSSERQKEKRRKISIGSTSINGRSSRELKSTAALFFQCLDQIGGRSMISQDNAFAMLAHIRLASSFHSQSSRIAAVERRLRALISVLYAHPMQDVLAGYFQAQPELCTEIGDLVRPIVSSTAISATGLRTQRASSSKIDGDEDAERRQAAIASIVEPATTSNVPYKIRIIAVEALTALVARKDESSSTGLSPVARLTNVLTELGVGKGQFLGLLPTLIRYSLASLNVFLSKKKQNENTNSTINIQNGVQHGESSPDIEELGLDLGLTFLEATRAPSDESSMESKAIEFVETVLSLAGSIISVSTGTTSLTDCGLVPALVSTIAQTSQVVKNTNDSPFEPKDTPEQKYCSSLLKFITSQSIQILEVAIITHNPALMAFHDLKTVDLLVTLLHSEFEGTKEETVSSEIMHVEEDCEDIQIKLNGSTRVLLFSILNCLTIVFHHQETNPRSNNAPMSAANVLNRPDLTQVLMTIMNHVHAYGGVLGAVATTLLSDIMNSDPKVVHYVYESGLADAFFRMIKGAQYVVLKDDSKSNGILDVRADIWHEPNIPVTAELIMSLPNVIIALALTEDGRKRLLQVNPIPELLSLMCTSRFSMPHTRCMLNDMSSLIGSGLDELIRHVPDSKSTVINALVATIERISYLGQDVADTESKKSSNESRICLMHYASNIGQALEHILQNEENCSEFVTAGGVDAILNLHPLLIVKGNELLSHISSQSSPSIANLSHSTAATSLMSTIKRAAVNGDPCKVIKKIMHSLMMELIALEKAGVALRQESSSITSLFSDEDRSPTDKSNGLNASGILECIPKVSLNSMQCEDLESDLLRTYADYLLEIINTEWLSQVIAEVVRVSCQRNSMTDARSLEGSSRLDWQKELASSSFQKTLKQLGILYRSAISEVCRVRSSADYEDLDTQRWKAPGDSTNHPASYKLRIVCADGAVVRNGIDIDSCDSVGNLEMGEEVLAFDRCINRSGIMRYRTSWGWVSEQTRGHGREPIAEIISIHGIAGSRKRKLIDQLKKRKPIDYGVADLRSIGASILARLQNSQSSLYTSLSRVTMTIARTRPFSQHCRIGAHIGTIVREIGIFLRTNFSLLDDEAKNHLSDGGLAMYLGNMLSIFHSTIYEERREKQYLNVLVLCNCLYHDGLHDSFLLLVDKTEQAEEVDIQTQIPKSGFYAAVRSVIKYGFAAIKEFQCQDHAQVNKRLDRVIASSLPTALSLLRRLSSQSLLIDPSLGDILQKMHIIDFAQFLCDPSKPFEFDMEGRIFSFRQDSFARSVHCKIGAIAHDFWMNKDLKHCPPHVLNSVLSLVQDVLTCVEDSAKKSSTKDEPENRLRRQFRSFLPASVDPPQNESEAAAAPNNSDDSVAKDDSVTKQSQKEPSEADKKKSAEEDYDLSLLAINRQCYISFKESLSPTAINLVDVLQEIKAPAQGVPSASQAKWLRDDEATSVVVGSFLLELCSRYPSDRSQILEQLLVGLESGMVFDPKGHASVIEGKEGYFTSACHTTVLLLRAMPKIRICALKMNTVSLLLQCLRSVTSKIRSSDFCGLLPSWVTPALLLLEVMAQPMVLPPKIDEATEVDEEKKADFLGLSKRRDDYDKVASEHKKQRMTVSKTAKRISSAFAQSAKVDSNGSENTMLSNWTEFPAFAPLVSAEAADHCLSICLQLLRRRKRLGQTGDKSIAYYLPPTAAHAIIMLLTKILCQQKVGSRCLRMGGADLLLGLHKSSRFKGHVPLVTQALRLMMEDEGTLQTEIEIELRSIVAKMLKKNGSGNGIPVKTFVQTATPLICRDPVVFLRAAATSIAVKKEKVDNEEEETLVTLLSIEERNRTSKIVQDCCRPSGPHGNAKATENSNKTPTKTPTKAAASSGKKRISTKKESANEKTARNKSPHHRQSKKSVKKERQEKGLTSSSPSNHITTLLLNEAIKLYQLEVHTDSDIPFICVFEYLEILGDLLLVIPSCSTAICNYKIPATLVKKKMESCGGLHYLLHYFLPQDRDFSNTNGSIELDTEVEQPITRKRDSFLKIRLAQCSSRLLVGLVARIGEGRRRVISELSSALQTGSFIEHNESDVNKSMCALQVS